MALHPSTARTTRAQVLGCLLQAGRQALDAGDVERAATYFREVVRLEPLSVAGWHHLATTQNGARRAICLRWAAYAGAHRSTSPTTRASRPALPARSYPRALIVGSAAAGLLLTILIGSDLAYRERILPGVAAGRVELGNLSRAAAIERLAAEQHRLRSRVLVFDAGDRAWQMPAGDVLHASPEQVVAVAFAYGHAGSFLNRAQARLWAVLGDDHRIDLLAIDAQAVERVVAALAAEIDQDRRDARLLRGASGWIIVPEQAGRTLDRAATTAQISAALRDVALSASSAPLRLALPIRQIPPRRTTAELESLRQALESLRALPLTLRAGDRSWTLDRSLLVTFDEASDHGNLQPDEAAIGRALVGLARAIDVSPQPSRLVREDGRVRELVWGTPGVELDQAAARQLIGAAIRQGAATLDLPLREVAPPPGEVEQLGLIAEIGRGDSQFASYSSPNRDANVAAGGRDVDGILLAPGEIFSFNATIGAITVEKGYQWGEMIEAGSVVPALGGGICQVSTTVFRAAFWSGLEILERHPHSWRLPWYEADAPAGMDATIALGGPDLRFRNNTGHHILIRVETDLQQKRQTVRIFGTPDGRTVAMQPFVAGGIGIYRRVQQGDASLAEEIFMSYYSQ